MDAAQTCPGLPWSVLAGIGTVESGNGHSNAPGVHSGHNFAGAEGPMQFLPATFAQYATGPDKPLSPYDPADAIDSAAAMLCASGPAAAPARASKRNLRLQPRRRVRQRIMSWAGIRRPGRQQRRRHRRRVHESPDRQALPVWRSRP